MTGPAIDPLAVLNQLGISTEAVQAFAVQYAAQWASIPARLNKVIAAGSAMTGDQAATGQNIVASANNLQAQYADISADVATLLQQSQTGNIDIGLAAQTLPRAYVVIQGVQRLERGATGVASFTSLVVNVPSWAWYIAGGGLLYWLFKRKKGRRR